MKLRIVLLIVFTLMTFVVAGCNSSDTNNAANANDDIGEWSITVEVDGGASVEFTNEDAVTVGPKDIIASEKDKDVFLDAQTWKGILFSDLLDYMNVDEFTVITVEGTVEGVEGTIKEFDADRLTDNTGFGWMVDGEMLDEESGPIELIADQRGPKWWIKDVQKITIIN